MTILFAIIIFMLVILFHELGHFLMAKKVGIKVNEFSVGMGPSIFQRQRGETLYSLRAIPLGGYTAMEGEDEESEDQNSFDNASPGARFLVILAGPIMNFIIALICFIVVSGMIGTPVPVVGGFSPDSPAKEAGLLEGDRILSINGERIEEFSEISKSLAKADGSLLMVQVQRGEEELSFSFLPEKMEGSYYLGITAKNERGVLLALKSGFVQTFDLLGQLFLIFFHLITGQLSLKAVSGPIGVIQVIGQAANQGLFQLVFLTGYISLNLCFFNLLPIPALDGSKLLFIAIEKLRRKRIPKPTEEKITMVGFVFLMAVILVVSVKDIINFF